MSPERDSKGAKCRKYAVSAVPGTNLLLILADANCANKCAQRPSTCRGPSQSLNIGHSKGYPFVAMLQKWTLGQP